MNLKMRLCRDSNRLIWASIHKFIKFVWLLYGSVVILYSLLLVHQAVCRLIETFMESSIRFSLDILSCSSIYPLIDMFIRLSPKPDKPKT